MSTDKETFLDLMAATVGYADSHADTVKRQLMELGVAQSAFEEGTIGFLFSTIGNFVGIMMQNGATLKDACVWILSEEIGVVPAPAASSAFAKFAHRMRTTLLDELRRICKPVKGGRAGDGVLRHMLEALTAGATAINNGFDEHPTDNRPAPSGTS